MKLRHMGFGAVLLCLGTKLLWDLYVFRHRWRAHQE